MALSIVCAPVPVKASVPPARFSVPEPKLLSAATFSVPAETVVSP